MAPKTDPWVRLFDVSDPVRHKKGYTVYKVTSTVYPRSAPEAATQIIVWKRFNDFKKLHKNLQILHSKLYLKGFYPQFAKSRFFGRFDENVIEERRLSAQTLLEFVAQHPPLFTSQIFVKFFECGQKISPDKIISSPNNTETSNSSNIEFDRSQDGSGMTSFAESEKCEPVEPNLNLGGIWRYRQEQETISLSSGSNETDDRTTTDADSVQSLNSTVELFDPLAGNSDLNRFVNNNVWLLSAMSENRKTDDSVSESCRNWNVDENMIEFDSKTNRKMSTSVEVDSLDESTSPPLTPVSPMSNEESDYIVSAANAISLAQRNEADGNYEMSFAFYKSSVEILLRGVQFDTNGLRRDAVRKKTAQYLSRAEDIYRKYLVGSAGNDDVRSTLSPTPTFGIMSLRQSPISDLRNYKVIGIIDKILLVLDMSTNNTFVMKILHKSSSPSESYLTSVAPSKLRYMVQLYKFIENDYAIFIILEYATGGRLWNYVKSYLVNSPTCPNPNFHAESFVIHTNQVPTNDSNVYSGRKLTKDEFVEEKKSESVETDDFVAKAECATSYVNLFTSYAASVVSDEKSLAKCRIKSNGDNFEFDSIEIPRTEKRVEEIIFDNFDTPKDDFDNVERVDLNQVTTLEDLGRLEADDLIDYAQKLMKTVDLTLKVSENVELSNSKLHSSLPTLPDPEIRKKTIVESKRRFRRTNSTTRQMSDDVFASPNHEIRRSASTGSLPGAYKNRLRHFSAVFEQLDSTNSTNVCLPESCVRVWAAEIIVAVWQLHNLGIICRDLCPNNILLGNRGHVLLTYFGQWAYVERILRLDAIENMYVAPELNGIDSPTPACDWWSVGALLFELLTGRSLISCHPGGITNHTHLNIPNHISGEAKSILIEFLRYNPTERLGAGANGIEAIKSHSFFHNINWDQIIYDT